MKLFVIVVLLMASPVLAKRKVDNPVEKARCHAMGTIARLTAEQREKGSSKWWKDKAASSAEGEWINQIQDWVWDNPGIVSTEVEQLIEDRCLRLGWYAGAKMEKTENAPVKSSDEDSIKELCSQRWPSDYVMQETCIRLQREAVAKLARWNSAHSEYKTKPMSPAGRMIATCWRRWGSDNVGKTDWVMMETCIRLQDEAYQKVR